MTTLRLKAFWGCLVLLALSACNRGGQQQPDPEDLGPIPVQAVYQGIDPATVAAYEKLGAIYGTMGTITAPDFRIGRDQAEKGLPGFRLGSIPQSKLPEVAVPFGLDLSGTEVTDAGLKAVAGLKNLSTLNLSHTLVKDGGGQEVTLPPPWPTSTRIRQRMQVTDGRLKELAPLKNLSTLFLDRTQVTNVGLRSLREIGLLHALWVAQGKDGARPKSAEEVISLNLCLTQVTNAGLKDLAALKNLTTLDLYGLRVTDAGLKELAPLKNLTALSLNSPGVTGAGVVQLRKELPGCTITFP